MVLDGTDHLSELGVQNGRIENGQLSLAFVDVVESGVFDLVEAHDALFVVFGKELVALI